MILIRLYTIPKIIVLLLYLSYTLVAQNQYSVEDLAKSLNQALINRNGNELKQLLHDDLTYGHSNGWVESKEELIHNNQTKYLIYENISMDSLSVKYSDNICVLRCQSMIDAVLNGKRVNLKLHMCQIWIKANGTWKLIARQSTKIN